MRWSLQAGEPLISKKLLAQESRNPGTNFAINPRNPFPSSLLQILVRRSRNYVSAIPSVFRTTMEGQSVCAIISVPKLRSLYVEQTVGITLMSVSWRQQLAVRAEMWQWRTRGFAEVRLKKYIQLEVSISHRCVTSQASPYIIIAKWLKLSIITADSTKRLVFFGLETLKSLYKSQVAHQVGAYLRYL